MSGIRLTSEQIAEITKKPGYATNESVPTQSPKRRKYRNQPVNDETGHYDSKLEAKHAAEFRLLLRAGAITAYARQIEVMLPGNVKMIIDHALMIRNEDGSWRIEFKDSKGAEPTRDWRNKQKQAASLGINVETI